MGWHDIHARAADSGSMTDSLAPTRLLREMAFSLVGGALPVSRHPQRVKIQDSIYLPRTNPSPQSPKPSSTRFNQVISYQAKGTQVFMRIVVQILTLGASRISHPGPVK